MDRDNPCHKDTEFQNSPYSLGKTDNLYQSMWQGSQCNVMNQLIIKDSPTIN